MEFVTFHVALSADQEVHPNQTVAHREYLAMVDMMFSSARAFHAGARRVVLTDQGTTFPRAHVHVDQLVRSALDGSSLMLERARAQLRHVQASAFRSPLVILDSDILINGSLADLFERDFDVALTWRAHPDGQPINGGLMILNNRRPEAARRFFEKFVAIYEQQYATEHAAWFGDQMALRDCVGLGEEELARRDIVEVDSCRILLLPCDVYNFSPANRLNEIGTPLTHKRVLHFKGERKRLMGPFWRAWLHPRTSPWPWVKLQGLWERRRLHNQREATRADRAKAGA